MSGQLERVMVRAALELAALAHMQDRPGWLDTAADMLASVWSDPPDRIRERLGDARVVWRALIHGQTGIDPAPDAEADPPDTSEDRPPDSLRTD